MVGTTSVSRKVFIVFNSLFLAFLTFIFLAPMLHVLFASISDPIELNRHQGLFLWPRGQLNIEGYRRVFRNPNILNGYINTAFYVIVGTFLSVIFTAAAGYAFSRKRFLMRNKLMLLITFTMLFNGGLIPTYMVVRGVGLLDSRWAMILPSLISAYNLIIMRTFFASISDSLEESARIDGANDFQVFFSIYMPLAKAGIAVMVLFYGVSNWNSWFPALIYLQSRDKMPLQMVLRDILIINDVNAISSSLDMAGDLERYRALVRYCTIIVATVPILFIYPLIQKHFVTGVMIGSIKE